MSVKIIDASESPAVALRRASGKRYTVAPRKVWDKPDVTLCSICGHPEPCNIHKDRRTEQQILVDIDRRNTVSLQREYPIYYSRKNLTAVDYERIKKQMAVKLIDEGARLMPRSKSGKFAMLSEVTETLAAIRDLPAGKAVQVGIETANFNALKKDNPKADPARSIVNYLRRKFIQEGLGFKAYASDEKTITVMREKPAPAKQHKK